jgi:hypothetical protein
MMAHTGEWRSGPAKGYSLRILSPATAGLRGGVWGRRLWRSFMKKLFPFLRVVVAFGIMGAGGDRSLGAAAPADAREVSRRVVAFYYPWYGNPETDGRYSNWNHGVAVRDEPPRGFPGGDDIGANFYPALGTYSVNNPDTLREHMRQLRQARVGVICASWWGKDTFTDRALPALFQAAEEAGILINFHIEPFPGRNAATTRAAIEYLVGKHGKSPALRVEPVETALRHVTPFILLHPETHHH